MSYRDFHGTTPIVHCYEDTSSNGRVIRQTHIISLRKDGFSPRFLEGDRGAGIYREFHERWVVSDDGSRVKLEARCPNVEDPEPKHGFLETGRRFELFDRVTPEFLEDMGLDRPLPGMLHLTDPHSLTVYRFRQV